MGVVKRQGSKQTIVTYVAILIGAVSTLFIYPKFLKPYQLGLIPFLNSVASLAVPLVMMGSASIIIRFFPAFRNDKNGHNGWLGFNLIIFLFGFVIFLVLVYLFEELILQFFSNKSDFFLKYIPVAIPIAFFLALTNLLSRHISNFQLIVVPSIVNNLFFKAVIPTLVVIYGMGFIDFEKVIYGNLVAYLLAALFLFYYLYLIGELKLKIHPKAYTKAKINEVATFGAYGLLGNLGGVIAIQIDIVMIAGYQDLNHAGIYSIAYYIASVMEAPRKALESIVNPILADEFNKGNTKNIAELYKKSSFNLFIIGILIFGSIIVSISSLYDMMSQGYYYRQGINVVFIIGLSILFDMLTGINGHVIGYSKYFRISFYLVIFLAIITILSNQYFIPRYGIEGAAIATLLSKSLFNIGKTTIVLIKLQLWPFDSRFVVVGIVGSLLLYIVYNLPHVQISFIDIGIRSSLFLICMLIFLFQTKISAEIYTTINNILLKLKIK